MPSYNRVQRALDKVDLSLQRLARERAGGFLLMWNMRNFTVRENLHEMKYWVNRWFALKGRSILFSVMPNWLVREAMLKASRHIANNEVVPEVPFTTVFERVYKGGVVDGSNAHR